MKKGRLSLVMAGLIGLLCMSTTDVNAAKTSVAGGTPSCLVANPGNGALAIRGTVAVELTSGIDDIYGSQDADFTLRLERSGQQEFFRYHLYIPALRYSNPELLCRLLDSNTNPDVIPFTQSILSAFGFPSTSQFVITNNSIINEEAATTDKTIPGTDYNNDGSPDHGSSMADIIIYVIK